MKGDEPVRLLHLGEKLVGTQSHGAGEGRADPLCDDGLHPSAEGEGVGLLGGREGADHLVDGADRLHGEHRSNGSEDGTVQLDVALVPGRHQHETGAEPPGLSDEGAPLEPEGLRLPAHRDEAGMLRIHGDHADRPAAQMRLDMLLGTGEERVEIEIEPLQALGLAHRPSAFSRNERNKNIGLGASRGAFLWITGMAESRRDNFLL